MAIGIGLSRWLPEGSTFRLNPPPATDLLEAKALQSRLNERTPPKLQEISRQSSGAIEEFFQAAGTTTSNCPAQSFFAMAIVSDSVDVVFQAKRAFSRKRPTEVLPALRPAIPVPWHAAYPSGHATQAGILAKVFATWYPERAAAFDAVASRVADNREIAGLHYRSDSVAGLDLAGHLFKAYTQHPQVQRFLKMPCRPGDRLSADQMNLYATNGRMVVEQLQTRLGQWKAAGDSR